MWCTSADGVIDIDEISELDIVVVDDDLMLKSICAA